jgi:1,4-dihydroxy-2-naphthoyl-CoA hydrolase
MSIWFNKAFVLDDLKTISKDTMGTYIGIELTEIGENYLKGRMPVDHRTRQPYGLLHGGASAALAETLGSIASAFVVDQTKYFCLGLEINANHIRSAREGFVYGTATPLHLGNSTHVWDIRIHDGHEKLVCASRLTVAILKRNL